MEQIPAPSDLPPVRVEFIGMDPAPGKEWCASCACRYMGELARNPLIKAQVKKRVQQAISESLDAVYIELPALPFFPLRYGVAHAPSVIFPNQMFWTCWVHMLPITPAGEAAVSGLIPGSAIRPKGKG